MSLVVRAVSPALESYYTGHIHSFEEQKCHPHVECAALTNVLKEIL